MKITVFTSNQPRHIHLIEKLAEISSQCHAILEGNTIHPGEVQDFFNKSEVMQAYFSAVMAAERKAFGAPRFLPPGVRAIAMKSGDLSRVPREVLAPALDADVFVVFGASYIRGWLIDELVERGAINIHMGVSPYYRGSSCNFWALYDGNPDLVGSTVHLLSKGLDSGAMLYHALPSMTDCDNGFDYTMRAVVAAHTSLVERIADGSIHRFEHVQQDKAHEVRYSRNAQFNDEVAGEFLSAPPGKQALIDAVAARGTDRFLQPFVV